MKRNGTNRVLIPGNHQDKGAIAGAIKLGIELSKKITADIGDVVLFVPTKKSIRNTSLESVVSERVAKLLQKGEQIPLGAGLGLRAETSRTYKNGSYKDMLIAIGADAKMMAKVDGMAGLHTVIAVPQKDGALDSWAETWSPLIPGAKKAAEQQILSDAIIETALTKLSGSIDLSEKVLAKQDKKQVDLTIRVLRRNKHQEKPAEIKTWAVKHGWPKKAADELKDQWQKVYALKNMPRVKDAGMAQKMYEGWV